MDVVAKNTASESRWTNILICRQILPQADAGTRTPDPFITSEVLYQLSYVGVAASLTRLGCSPAPALPPRGLRGHRRDHESIGIPMLAALARQSSARMAQRSWSRQRPPIFR